MCCERLPLVVVLDFGSRAVSGLQQQCHLEMDNQEQSVHDLASLAIWKSSLLGRGPVKHYSVDSPGQCADKALSDEGCFRIAGVSCASIVLNQNYWFANESLFWFISVHLTKLSKTVWLVISFCPSLRSNNLFWSDSCPHRGFKRYLNNQTLFANSVEVILLSSCYL